MLKLVAHLDAFLDRHVMLKQVGGLYHWRVGRVGGSLYIKRARVAKQVTPYKRPVEVDAAPVALIAGPTADRMALALARLGQSTYMRVE